VKYFFKPSKRSEDETKCNNQYCRECSAACINPVLILHPARLNRLTQRERERERERDLRSTVEEQEAPRGIKTVELAPTERSAFQINPQSRVGNSGTMT